LATLKEIAQAAGVSISTVSRVLNGKAKEESISPRVTQKVERIAHKMSFRFNSSARATRLKSARHVGVLLRNVIEKPHCNPAAFDMILGANARLAPAGYIVSIVRYGDREGTVQSQSRVFREQMLDAMMVIGVLPEDVEQHVEELMPNCIWIESNRYTSHNCLRRDEVYSGELAARALGESGYRRWLWLSVTKRKPDAHYSISARLSGVQKMAKEYGAELFQFPQTGELPSDPDLLKDYLQPDVGIIAYNHLHAHWCASVAERYRKNAPYDFGLVCCDDMFELRHVWPELSRVQCDLLELGKMAGDMVLRLLHEGSMSCPSQQIRGFWHEGSTVIDRNQN
jgi:DNA-binding LacI/PurR family transcriptional regulator